VAREKAGKKARMRQRRRRRRRVRELAILARCVKMEVLTRSVFSAESKAEEDEEGGQP
jgi:hypothetical protein